MPDDAKPEGHSPAEDPDRRDFIKNASRVAMTAGVVGGYGGFAAIAGRYLYPSRTGEVMWQFVSEVAGIDVGEAIRYRGPSGETINITRMARDGGSDDFIALSRMSAAMSHGSGYVSHGSSGRCEQGYI